MPQFKKLLEPGSIKNVRIKNRVSMAPMEKQTADRRGNVTQPYIDYMVERAKNGVGMITMESMFIDPVGRGNMFQLGLWDESNIASHQRLNDALHEYGTVTVTELQHAGRNASTLKTGFQPIAPSSIPCEVSGGFVPREMTLDDIKRVIDMYAAAADRAKRAGYDMVTLHGAHGYMLNAFLSPYSNKRTDAYGGSTENRWRFGIEVLQAVQAAVGDSVPVGYRITADEFIDGGLTLEDTVAFAKKMEALGLDYLDVSAGIYETAPMIVQPMDFPLGCLLPYAAGLKEALNIPVIGTGRINDMAYAEKVLERNEADYIHMVRAFHADPEILVKSQQGAMDEICMCMGCNKCIDLMFGDQRVLCTVNPAAGREREMTLRPAKDKKKVMVIGGGLAGMEAARIAALRGHDVTLYEKEHELGGAMRWASKGQYREEWWQTARYRIHSLGSSGAKVVVGKEVTLADVKEARPDVAVVATGTEPFVPPYLPGVEKALVTTYADVLLGRTAPGRNAVVVGGQDIGLATAEFLSEQGCSCTIVEDTETLGADLGGIRQMVVLPRVDADPNITVRLNANLEDIGDDWVEIQSGGGTRNPRGSRHGCLRPPPRDGPAAGRRGQRRRCGARSLHHRRRRLAEGADRCDLRRGGDRQEDLGAVRVPRMPEMAVSDDIWILLEADGNRLDGRANGLMHEAGRLAKRSGGRVSAVLLGPRIAGIAGRLGAHGVSALYHQRNDDPFDDCPDALARLLADLLSAHAPRLLLSVASSFSTDLMPRVAAKLGASLVTNCVRINLSGKIEFTRSVQNGRLSATLVTRTPGTQLATVLPEMLTTADETGPSGAVELHSLQPCRSEAPRKVRFCKRIRADHKTVDIRHADVVLALGDGIGGPENLAIYESFADMIGAAIGGTRPVVDSGCLPYDRQVGQTGKKIAPTLAILCGISGHEYFMNGIEKAGTLVAINTDRKARVFAEVDLGIVADVNLLVPRLMERIEDEESAASAT